MIQHYCRNKIKSVKDHLIFYDNLRLGDLVLNHRGEYNFRETRYKQ